MMEAQVEILSDIICQCCLSTQNLKSMTQPFVVENKTEVYYDMITECFTNNLMRDKGKISDTKYNLFICDGCVDVLRLCCNFRSQVERSQEKLDVYKLTLTLQETKYNHDINLPAGIKEENSTNDFTTEDFYFADNGVDQESDDNEKFHITQIKTISKRKFKTLGNEEITPLEQKVQNALTRIKSNNILFDRLIHKESKKNDPVETINSTQIRPEIDLDIHDDETQQNLHHKIVNLINHNTIETRTYDGEDYVVPHPNPKKRPKNMSHEEYKRRCRIYFKKIRQGLKPYRLNESDRKCNVCGEEFNSYQHLAVHMHEHYPKFVCEKCGKGFAVRASLSLHLHVHEERVPCPVCNKPTMKTYLPKHIKGHLGEKTTLRCPTCKEHFKTFRSRATHMEKEHNIVNRYPCKLCDKVFDLTLNLRRHVRRKHTYCPEGKNRSYTRGSKAAPKECTVCGKTFRERSKLERHQKAKHSKERKYECHLCFRSYLHKDSLTQHLKDYHYNASTYPCHLCDKVVKVRRQLTAHLKKVHNIFTGVKSQTKVQQSNGDD